MLMKNKYLQIKLSETDLYKLRKMKDINDTTLSNYVRNLIDKDYENYIYDSLNIYEPKIYKIK